VTWTKLDDGFWMHPKVLMAGNTAAGIFARMLAYCGAYLTDGLVPEHIAVSIAGPDKRALDALVTAELAERLESGGYYIPDFLEHNRSKRQVDEDRAQRRANGKKGGRPTAPELRRVK
jgi:hypothetical protein